MQAALDLSLLDNPPAYAGEELSARALEAFIQAEREVQNTQVEELVSLRARNEDLQRALAEEMQRLRETADELAKERARRGTGQGFWEFLGRLPFFGGPRLTRRSIEALLRGQYEMSALRLKQAAAVADRLEVARSDLFDEIDRLNARIITSAQNEQQALHYLARLADLQTALALEAQRGERTSLRSRELQALLDRTRRLLVEHQGRRTLYATAAERLEALKANTAQLAETIAYLRADLQLYLSAASEQLDAIGGQIQAIGAAADAAVVMLELRQSLQTMTEAINHTTQFVSETQAYFRTNVDHMIEDLRVYDAQTQAVLEYNLGASAAMDELGVRDLVAERLSREIEALAEPTVLDLGSPEAPATEAHAEPVYLGQTARRTHKP